MTAYFAYEMDFANRPCPVVFFDKPSKSVNGSEPSRSKLHEIDASYLGLDGHSPDFGRLKREFPV